MRNSIKVYWASDFGSLWNGQLSQSLEKSHDLLNVRDISSYSPLLKIKELQEIYSKSDVLQQYLKCPALINSTKNLFTIKSDLSLNLTSNFQNNINITPLKQDWINNNIIVRSHNPTVMSMAFRYLFFSKEELEITQYPAFLDNNEFTQNTTLLTGKFDISRWYRPIDATFILNNNKLTINRGDNLFYVKFNTTKKVILKNFHLTPLLKSYMLNCTNFKWFKPSSSLQYLYNIFTAKNYNQRILKEIKNNLTGY